MPSAMRCETCKFFSMPSPRDKWGWCKIIGIQVSKHKRVCGRAVKFSDEE